MPWIGFVFLMGHMAINHIHRQTVNDPDVVDITGPQMVLVMKLTAFCWNIYDGQQPTEQLADFQKERAVSKLPGLLDYAGYVMFFPSLWAGPAFDYADYARWLETSLFDLPPGSDPAKAAKTRGKRRIPRSGTPATLKAVTGLFWIYMFLQFNGWYNPELVLGDTFMQYSFLRRVWILEMLGVTSRMRYYGIWYLTEGACILSGLGYRGVDPKSGKVLWNRLQNVNPWGIESAQNTQAYLGNWNMNTNNWLRNYMYLRVTPKGKKPGFRASMATFATSAFWHGFYPGYYLSFILAAFLQTIAKNTRRHVRPLFLTPDGKNSLPSKRYYDFATYLITQLAFCFTTVPFVILTLPDSLLVWGRVYFYTIIGVIGSMAFFNSPAKGWLIKQQKARVDRATATTGAMTPSLKTEKSSANLLGSDPSKYPQLLGLPEDPGKEVEEAIQEVLREVEATKKQGGPSISLPTPVELRRMVEEKLGKRA